MLSIFESFLTAAINLQLLFNVSAGLVRYSNDTTHHREEDLPLTAPEIMLVAASSTDGDHQHLPEAIEKRSWLQAVEVLSKSIFSSRLDRTFYDEMLNLVKHRLDELCSPKKHID